MEDQPFDPATVSDVETARLALSIERDSITTETMERFFCGSPLEIQAKVASSVRSGQVIIYHAWEPYQFKDGKSHQSLIPSPMNPIHLAGGYFQLQPTVLMGEPGCPDRGTRVEIESLA